MNEKVSSRRSNLLRLVRAGTKRRSKSLLRRTHTFPIPPFRPLPHNAAHPSLQVLHLVVRGGTASHCLALEEDMSNERQLLLRYPSHCTLVKEY